MEDNNYIFLQEYLGQFVDEDNSYFKILSRLAAIDYILETEEFDAGLLGKNSEFIINLSRENAARVKQKIKRNNEWKNVWPFIIKYRDNWSTESLKGERQKLEAILKK